MDAMEQILREPQVIEITGLSRTTLWRLEQCGCFPRRRRLGGRSVGWLKSEICEWITSRPQAAGREAQRGAKKREGRAS
ncbi:MAG: AlpA family transcriptional regulator [Deltaproteobacteria bacterium]|nr:AlpA family transcriptional regulator [Deltaproteobacteria bacterium]